MSSVGRRAAFGAALLRAMRHGAPLGLLPVRADAAPPAPSSPGAAADIRTLGAAGDGVADDTEAFRAALSDHKALFVPAGVYRLTGSLKLASATLLGTGPSSVLKADGAQFDILEVSGTGSRVEGLALEGGAIDETSGQFAIVTSTRAPPTDFSVFDVRFSGTNNGIKFEDGARDCRVENNHFERLVGKVSGRGYGILTGKVDGLIVLGNTFAGSRTEGHGRHAVYVSAGGRRVNASHNIVRDFNSEALTTSAYQHQEPVDEIVFSYNIIDRCGGIGPSQTSIGVFGRTGSAVISHNIVHRSFGCGLLAEAGRSIQEAVIFEGNVVVDAACVGIRQYGALRQIVRNNHVRGSSRMSPQTYSDIMVGSGGAHAPQSIVVSGNQCAAADGIATRSFLLNATTPLPLSVRIDGNDFPAKGYAMAPEYGAGTLHPVIDGRLQFRIAWAPSRPENRSGTRATFEVPGAEPGDLATCAHPAAISGYVLSAVVTAPGTVELSLIDVAAAAGQPPGGQLAIDVWKSAGSK